MVHTMKLDALAKKYIFILILVVIIIAIITLNIRSDFFRDNGEKTGIERIALLNGEIPYTDLEGNPVDIAEFKGKVLVVNAWASWCPFCVGELPDFGELANSFGDDVVVIAINRKEPVSTARSFLQTIEVSEDVLFLQDKEDFFYESIGGFTMPETIFYDRNGDISFHKRGFMALEEMRMHTEDALTDDS